MWSSRGCQYHTMSEIHNDEELTLHGTEREQKGQPWALGMDTHCGTRDPRGSKGKSTSNVHNNPLPRCSAICSAIRAAFPCPHPCLRPCRTAPHGISAVFHTQLAKVLTMVSFAKWGNTTIQKGKELIPWSSVDEEERKVGLAIAMQEASVPAKLLALYTIPNEGLTDGMRETMT